MKLLHVTYHPFVPQPQQYPPDPQVRAENEVGPTCTIHS